MKPPVPFPKEPHKSKAMLDWLRHELKKTVHEDIDEFWKRINPIGHQAEIHGTDEELWATVSTLYLDYEPLCELLEAGNLSPVMQRWLADYIRHGGFRERKKIHERLNQDLINAVIASRQIRNLWRNCYVLTKGREHATGENASRCAAALYDVHFSTIEQYTKRSAKELRRIFR